jgi:hypothetical protein
MPSAGWREKSGRLSFFSYLQIQIAAWFSGQTVRETEPGMFLSIFLCGQVFDDESSPAVGWRLRVESLWPVACDRWPA